MVEKSRKIFRWFDSHYFPKWADITLDSLSYELAQASMPVDLRLCTGDRIVTGGIHVLIANAVAVSLAMMHSENFTPLAEISEMKFIRPITLKDKKIIAKASFSSFGTGRIKIGVEIKNPSGEIKALGVFQYAALRTPYNPH